MPSKQLTEKMTRVGHESGRGACWLIIRTQYGYVFKTSKRVFNKAKNSWADSEWFSEDDVHTLYQYVAEALQVFNTLKASLDNPESKGKITADELAGLFDHNKVEIPKGESITVQKSFDDDDIPF